jgi:hypothetical protein
MRNREQRKYLIFILILLGLASCKSANRTTNNNSVPKYYNSPFCAELKTYSDKTFWLITGYSIKGYQKGKLIEEIPLISALDNPKHSSDAIRLLQYVTEPPSEKIRERVKKLAIQKYKSGSDIYSSILNGWDYYKKIPYLWKRGKLSDGISIFLEKAFYSAGLYCEMKIENNTSNEIHIYPDLATWTLLDVSDKKHPIEISKRNLFPTYKEIKYYILPTHGRLGMTAVMSHGAMPYERRNPARLFITLNCFAKNDSDVLSWVGNVSSPIFEVILPPPTDSKDISYWHRFLENTIKKGAFPKGSKIRWSEMVNTNDFRIEENKITGYGIWFAIPDNLRNLSKDEVKTICYFLIKDDLFARGFINELSMAGGGAILPYASFEFESADKKGEWQGSYLKPEYAKEWQKIQDDLLKPRLEEARKRLKLKL